jgi:phosphomannomutase
MVEEHSMNKAITGTFAHSPEPGVSTMRELAGLVKRVKADVGFIQDPDADRLAVVDENGDVLSEEYTLALAAKNLLMKKKGDVAVNLSTSRMIDDIAREKGVSVYRTKIGEINVSQKIAEKRLYFGGEGNGGVIYPPVSPGRDSLLAIALILELMAQTGKTVSELAAEIPRYYMVKDKMKAQGVNTDEIFARMKGHYKNAQIHDIDGIKADLDDGWVHVRPSNTEPIIRIFAEAKSPDRTKALIREVKRLLNR